MVKQKRERFSLLERKGAGFPAEVTFKQRLW